ncbi:MAG: hypothetical protein PHF39_03015, partial [Methanoregula sp.]|nr:hypothetical protein [Methanoregula sp.]
RFDNLLNLEDFVFSVSRFDNLLNLEDFVFSVSRFDNLLNLEDFVFSVSRFDNLLNLEDFVFSCLTFENARHFAKKQPLIPSFSLTFLSKIPLESSSPPGLKTCRTPEKNRQVWHSYSSGSRKGSGKRWGDVGNLPFPDRVYQ